MKIIHNKTKGIMAPVAVMAFAVPMTIMGLSEALIGNTSAALQCNKHATTIDEAICMQDMNDSVKESMVSERQYRLKDKRDNKYYYVSKLADGNVWMTQNLDFDLDSTVTLTSEDTDIKTDWKPERSTYQADETDWGLREVIEKDNGDENEVVSKAVGLAMPLNGWTHPESYDPGEYYWNGEWNLPEESTPELVALEEDQNGGTRLATEGSQASEHEELPLILVSDSAYVITTSDNAHNSIGNYYNWTAAIATNDSEGFYDENGYPNEVDQSICPAGWTLPAVGITKSQTKSRMLSDIIGPSDDGNDYSFSGLMHAYQDFDGDISGQPMYFIPSGVWTGSLGLGSYGIGSWGSYWTNTSLWFAEAYAYEPDNNDYHSEETQHGYPIRCVARSRAAVKPDEIEDEDIVWTNDATYELKSGEEVVMRVNAPLDEFISVSVDDILLVEDEEYVATSGSTIITFANAYLDTLEPGEYEVLMLYTGNREAKSTLTVTETEDVAVPNTGMFSKDGSSSVQIKTLMVLLPFVATSIIIGIIVTKSIARKQHVKNWWK